MIPQRRVRSALLPTIAWLILAATIAGAAPALAADKVRVPCQDPVPGRYIVILEEGSFRDQRSSASSLAPSISELSNLLGSVYQGRRSAVLEHALKGFTVDIDDRNVQALANDPRVDFVEQACPVGLAGEQLSPPWGLDRVDQSLRPLNASYRYNETGAGVNVYVIDTGISSHGDFGSRLRAGRNFFPDNGLPAVPTNTADCWSTLGHGTAVAGIIGASSKGVAKGVNLYPIRVYGCAGSSDSSLVATAVDWVTGNHVKPAVANLSLSYLTTDTVLDVAVSNAINAGVVAVMAAGNDNALACTFSPGRVAAGLTVGATTQGDQRWVSSPSFGSNYGSCVDLFAPGDQISATANNGGFATYSATSFATPHVSGAAALYLQGNPTASVATVNSAILANATSGVLNAGTLGAGSPNKLLFAKPTDACFAWSCDPSTRTCQFNAGCSRIPQGLAYYSWNFGDGQTAMTTSSSTSHTYATNDLFYAQLSAVPLKGLADADAICVNVTFLGTNCYASGQTP